MVRNPKLPETLLAIRQKRRVVCTLAHIHKLVGLVRIPVAMADVLVHGN